MLTDLVNQLNSVEPTTDVTFQTETNYSLLFLDIISDRNYSELNSDVYRKPTNKKRPAQFYSNH